MKRSKLFRAGLIAAVAVAVLAVWGVKQAQDKAAAQAAAEAEAANAYPLTAESIDLETLTAQGLPVVIDFGADWCPPCREFEPIFEDLYSRTQGKAILQYVDVDESADTAAQFPVSAIPTQVFYAADGTPYVPSADVSVSFDMYADKDNGAHIFTVHQGSLTEAELTSILTDMGATP